MDKKIKQFIPVLFIVALVLVCMPAFAGEAIGQTEADKYRPKDRVNISGSSTAELMTIQVNGPRGNIVFIDQVTVTENQYSTSFRLGRDAVKGEYLITALSDHKTATYTFQVCADDSGSPSNGDNDSDKNTPGKTVIDQDFIDTKTVTGDNGETIKVFTVNRVARAVEEVGIQGGKTIEYLFKTGGENENQVDTYAFKIPSEVLENTGDLSIVITSSRFSLELPKAMAKRLVESGRDVFIRMKWGDLHEIKKQMGDMQESRYFRVIGSPVVINTDLEGNVVVNLPLTGVDIPSGADEEKAFLENLRVLVIHNDGRKEIITGEIMYDDQERPLAVRFAVTEFSTFALINFDKPAKEIKLILGESRATVNGKTFILDARPYIKRSVNRALIPIRFIAEVLGAEVYWNKGTKTAQINDGSIITKLIVGSNTATVDGENITLDCPPQIVSGRILVLLRFANETLGATVDYNNDSKQVLVMR